MQWQYLATCAIDKASVLLYKLPAKDEQVYDLSEEVNTNSFMSDVCDGISHIFQNARKSFEANYCGVLRDSSTYLNDYTIC